MVSEERSRGYFKVSAWLYGVESEKFRKDAMEGSDGWPGLPLIHIVWSAICSNGTTKPSTAGQIDIH
jgi:hypothetical protein